VKPIVVGNDEIKPWIRGKHSYDEHRKKISSILKLGEVFAPRAYRKVVREDNGQVIEICYDNQGAILSSTRKGDPTKVGRARFESVGIALPQAAERVKRFSYLVHVIAQCGLREKAVRPLWRLLRIGYSIRFSNFKRLVGIVARKCNTRFDFVRDLSAPPKGLRKIPCVSQEARTHCLMGINVPGWTYSCIYDSNLRGELGLD